MIIHGNTRMVGISLKVLIQVCFVFNDLNENYIEIRIYFLSASNNNSNSNVKEREISNERKKTMSHGFFSVGMILKDESSIMMVLV